MPKHRDWCVSMHELMPDEDPPDLCWTSCPACGTDLEVPHFATYVECVCGCVFDPGYTNAAAELARSRAVW